MTHKKRDTAPAESPAVATSSPMKLIHILKGGPEHLIQVNGKLIRFEMHRYCGPIALNKDGKASKKQPMAFLKAASLWAQQGQRIEDGLCRWDHPPKEILRHLGGRHYAVEGYEPAVKGT